MSLIHAVILLISALFAATGQYFLKIGADGNLKLFDFVNFNIFVGAVLYVLGAVLWVYILAFQPLTKVFPFTALTFIFVYILSVFLLGEAVTSSDFLGIILTILGLTILVYSS